jgi:hypothetical protein
VSNGEREIDEVSRRESSRRSPEEDRITFHRLVKTVSDAILAEGRKARAERTRLGGANTRPLEEFEQRVLAATLALAGLGELAEITAQVNQFVSESSGDSAVFFTLSRLEGEGFISCQVIQATGAEKGKVLFKVTGEGECVLADQKRSASATARSLDS